MQREYSSARLLLPVISMAAVLLLSNVLVQYPINDWLTWGAFSYPLCFLVTDLSNRRWGAAFARRVVYVGFALGVLISYYFADERIAIASGSAFLLAQLLDVAIFARLRAASWWRAPLLSSLTASVVDTYLFFAIAFVGTGLPWGSWAVGDLSVKLVMALALLPVYRVLVGR